MQSQRVAPNVHSYVSDRVFDGTRPLPADRVAKLRAKHQRVPVAAPARRSFGLWAAVVAGVATLTALVASRGVPHA